MRKIKILILLVLIGCGQKEFSSSINYSKQTSFSVKRNLASEKNVQCFEDRFKENYLKDEIEEFESYRLDRKNSEFKWRGVDVTHFNSSEKEFLKLFGERIGDLSQTEVEEEFLSCQNLVCLINKIYRDKIPEAGYVHYLWFLKTHQLLSFDNLVPKQKSKFPGEFNKKKISFDDYLFSKSELKSFWILLHLLDEPFSEISSLKEIQRVPRGELFEEASFKDYCGLASPAGWIKLTDECLLINDEKRNSKINLSVVHEISHQLDFDLGKKEFNASYRSHQSDYLKVSGFSLEEFIDERGFIFRNWKASEDFNYLTPYSKTNPQENFSEVVAHYFLNAQELKQNISEEQYIFLKENVFVKNEFLAKDLISSWIKKRSSDFYQQVFDQFIKCEFSAECFSLQKKEIHKDLVKAIKWGEPFSCQMLEDDSIKKELDEMIDEILQKVIKNISSKLDLFSEDHFFLTFRENNFKEKTGVASFLKCYSLGEGCYERSIREDLGEEFGGFYLKMYSWKFMSEFVHSRISELVMNKEAEVEIKTGLVWKSCQDYDSKVTVREIEFEYLSSSFMDFDFLTCLNLNLETLVDSISQNIGEIEHDSEKKIIQNQVLALVKKKIEEQYLISKTQEVQDWKKENDCLSKENTLLLKFNTPENLKSSGDIRDCKSN